MAHLSAAVGQQRDIAERLIIEITETAVIRSLEEASRFVAMLHDLGCRAAIDDFGAGFSSFRGLRVLDADFVKIDGAFIENMARSDDDRAFVTALADLARNFGVTAVAERVASEEVVSALAGLGIDLIQGSLTGAASVTWPPASAPSNPG